MHALRRRGDGWVHMCMCVCCVLHGVGRWGLSGGERSGVVCCVKLGEVYVCVGERARSVKLRPDGACVSVCVSLCRKCFV